MDILVSWRLLVVDQIATITWRANRFSALIADNSLYVIVARCLSRPVPDQRCPRTTIFPLLVSTPHDDCSQRFRKRVRHPLGRLPLVSIRSIQKQKDEYRGKKETRASKLALTEILFVFLARVHGNIDTKAFWNLVMWWNVIIIKLDQWYDTNNEFTKIVFTRSNQIKN